MTRITIEIDGAGTVTTTGSPTNPTALAPPSPAADETSGGAINAGSAPILSQADGPMRFIPSSSSTHEIPPGAISAGPAPASVFHSSGGNA